MLHIFIEAEFMNQNLVTLWFYKFHTFYVESDKVEGSTDYLEEVEGHI